MRGRSWLRLCRGRMDGTGKRTVGGVGGLEEKKSGGVELKGRKEATAKVLEPELAGMVRLSRFFFSLYVAFCSHFCHSFLCVLR